MDRRTHSLVNATNDFQNHITQKQSLYPSGFPRKVLAEVIGTYLLVFVGSGSAAMNAIDENKVSKLGASMAGGFIVTVMIYAIGHISGAHMNPAVSLAFATVSHFPWKQVPFYIAAQLTGAISASYTLKVLLEPSKQLGATSPSGSNIQALIIEIVTTFTMVLISTAVSTDPKASDIRQNSVDVFSSKNFSTHVKPTARIFFNTKRCSFWTSDRQSKPLVHAKTRTSLCALGYISFNTTMSFEISSRMHNYLVKSLSP